MTTLRPATETDYHQRMLRVLIHVQQNLDQPMSLDELAAIARFSPYHFHRIFRGMIGETLAQHIKRLRLERAAMRLRLTSRSVTTISIEAGYESHEGFTRAFNSMFGCSPTAYREQRQGTLDTLDARVHLATDPKHIALPEPSESSPMKVRIKTLPDMRVAFARHVGPYHDAGVAWERLLDWADERGHVNDDTRLFGTCHDDPDVTRPAQLRYDACLTVGEDVIPEGDIGVQVVPGGRFACVIHEGPYENLNETYVALFGEWFASQRLEPGPPPCLELYLNKPDCTPPEELLTEVCARIGD